jgi:hypothetical protein
MSFEALDSNWSQDYRHKLLVPSLNHTFKKATTARCQWLMPIILATQEVVMRRIVVQSQYGQIVP